jgi:hypothetical protein
MGFMVALEEETTMVMGLRMEYLSKSPAVREFVLSRLADGATALEVAANDIEVIGPDGNPVTFNILNDNRSHFVQKLNLLLPDEGYQYLTAEEEKVPHNQDHPGNRRRIYNWWQRHANSQGVDAALTAALEEALSSGESFKVSWEATLDNGSEPSAGFDGNRIFLRTDRRAVSGQADRVTPEPPN